MTFAARFTFPRPLASLRSAAVRIARPAVRAGLSPLRLVWPSFSRLMLVNEATNWVLSWELREIRALCTRFGVRTVDPRLFKFTKRQSVFFSSHFDLLLSGLPWGDHRLGTTYFHGKPGTGVPDFDTCHANLCLLHSRMHRIQVSHTEMRDVVLESGIDPAKVFLIPIGINLSFFPPQTPESKREARSRLGIPQSSVVVGSFQKDGVGWNDGLEPKLIKGPDVFLDAVAILKESLPELFVLLSGPARGFVKRGLERLGIPYKHVYLDFYPDVAGLFQALDLYIVPARQEGGPKAILESMASRIPIITTRVGQAMDLVQHGINGWMVDGEDVEGLAHWARYALEHPGEVREVTQQGLITAHRNSYESQIPLWHEFMTGFVKYDHR